MSKITITKGQKVYWNDPASETSGEYAVSESVILEDADDDTPILISNGNSEAQVLFSELELKTEIVKDIDECYSLFIAERGYEPLHVMCVVKLTSDGSNEDYTVALRPDTGEFADFYCKSLEHFKQLTEPNDEHFIVVDCEDFID